jgi:AcrR family transcriptional regulator
VLRVAHVLRVLQVVRAEEMSSSPVFFDTHESSNVHAVNWTVKYSNSGRPQRMTRRPHDPPTPPKADAAGSAPPLRGRPRDPERLRRILDAARSHFHAHGFDRANLDAIAHDAGVSKMTVYSHFSSKEGLFEAVIGTRTDGVVAARPGAAALDPQQPEAALSAIGAQFLALVRDGDTLGQFRTLYGAAATQPEACAAFYRQGPDRLMVELAAYLRAAHAAGTLRVPQPRLAADLFLSMFLGDGHIRGLLRLPALKASQDKAHLREAVRVFMAAFGNRSA